MQGIDEIKKLPYNECVRYAEQVIEFAKNNRQFNGNPDYYLDMCNTVAMIEALPAHKVTVDRNYVWYRWHKSQRLTKEQTRIDRLIVEQSLAPPDNDYVFLTVGFDDKTDIDYPKMCGIADQILRLNGGKFVKSADYVLEKFRAKQDGEIYCHHHIHFLIQVAEKMKRSKIIESVFKLAGIKKYVTKPNFIDVKTPNHKDFDKRAQPYAVLYNYVKGIKTSSKLKCLEMDTEWRDSYNGTHHPNYTPV